MRRVNSGFGNWAEMAMQSTLLALESQQVIALRLAKLGMGEPDAAEEAHKMVSEKLQAVMDSGEMMLKATLGGDADFGAGKIIRHYRAAVRANRRRLSK